MEVKELIATYHHIKKKIIKRLAEFEKIITQKDEKKILLELMFCILTPQSKAKLCWKAIENLNRNNLLCSNYPEKIKTYLNGVRFKNKKAQYMVEARKNFNSILKVIYHGNLNIFDKRKWLVKTIKGLGYKEASHFLRNIGLGENLSILDRHILKNLQRLKVIPSIPKNLSTKKYLEIEKKMRAFSLRIKIPMSHLDLLFWYNETGEIFK